MNIGKTFIDFVGSQATKLYIDFGIRVGKQRDSQAFKASLVMKLNKVNMERNDEHKRYCIIMNVFESPFRCLKTIGKEHA
jgi:hypothetical protein